MKAKAKGEPAPKRQRTCATAEEEARSALVLASVGKSSFHRATTKMRGLLAYRASAKCIKAYISLFM